MALRRRVDGCGAVESATFAALRERLLAFRALLAGEQGLVACPMGLALTLTTG